MQSWSNYPSQVAEAFEDTMGVLLDLRIANEYRNLDKMQV